VRERAHQAERDRRKREQDRKKKARHEEQQGESSGVIEEAASPKVSEEGCLKGLKDIYVFNSVNVKCMFSFFGYKRFIADSQVFARYTCFRLLVNPRFLGKRYVRNLRCGPAFKTVGAVGVTHTGFEIAAAMLTSPSVHSRDNLTVTAVFSTLFPLARIIMYARRF